MYCNQKILCDEITRVRFLDMILKYHSIPLFLFLQIVTELINSFIRIQHLFDTGHGLIYRMFSEC